MANCERCGKEFEERGETEASGICCSGYAMFEVDLCPECLVKLEKFMEGQNGGDKREN